MITETDLLHACRAANPAAVRAGSPAVYITALLHPGDAMFTPHGTHVNTADHPALYSWTLTEGHLHGPYPALHAHPTVVCAHRTITHA